MAILRSLDGKFYEVPDDDLTKFEMPEEKVKEMGADDQAADDVQGHDMMGPQDAGSGNITVNLNFGGGGGGGQMMGPPPGQDQQQGDQQQDVQGHHRIRWIYRNRYYAYRNRYYAYYNRY